MVGLGQPQLHVKFELASFSRCTNIDFMMALTNPSCAPNSKSVAPAVVTDGQSNGQTDGRTYGIAVAITALCIASNAAAL